MPAKKKANIRKAVGAQAKGKLVRGVRSETGKSKAGELDSRESKAVDAYIWIK
jgi:hypothetical protein